MSISLSTPPSTGRGRYCRKRRRLIPTASLPFIMILWTTKGILFLKNKHLNNDNIPLRLAHVDGRSLRSASSFTFSNNAFNEDSYINVFNPSFDIEKMLQLLNFTKMNWMLSNIIVNCSVKGGIRQILRQTDQRGKSVQV